MIATITLQFFYDEQEYNPPNEWAWEDILDLDSVNSIRIKGFSETQGRVCYFCGDLILDEPQWLTDEEMGKVPFHAGCFPPAED